MLGRYYNKALSVISAKVIQHYEKKERKKLKNKDFTILCSNCIGGIIYNRLGLRFLSPTVNMWFSQRDFIKFATNLHYYLSLPLLFVESEYNYPVAQCGDILLHFNHHDNPEDAENDWNKRKSRINYSNIFIIFYNREAEQLTLEEIRMIEDADCINLACLTSTELPLDYAVKMKPSKALWGDYFIDKNFWGVRSFEKQWDFVGWLNTTKNNNLGE